MLPAPTQLQPSRNLTEICEKQKKIIAMIDKLHVNLIAKMFKNRHSKSLKILLIGCVKRYIYICKIFVLTIIILDDHYF